MVPVGNGTLPSWRFDGFKVDRAGSEQDGLASIAEWPCDAAILVADHDTQRVSELCELLEKEMGADMPPLFVAVNSHTNRTVTSLSQLNADGLLDLGWPEAFARECIELVVNRVRSGRAVVGIQNELFRAVSSDIRALRNLSIRDELTGLFNLRHFREVVEREHLRCRRHARSYALAVIDLDNLRTLNNTYGHPAGTRALLRVARAIGATVRDSDYPFRIGGDEFVVLLVETDSDGARAYAERVSALLRHETAIEEDATVRLSISVGISSFPDGGDAPEDVLKSADVALYKAKAQGRNRVLVSEVPRGAP